MHAYTGRMLASKWLKTGALLSNPQVSRHIPPTRLYNPGNLRTMLSNYGMVVIKPVCGAGGHGVMKISRNGKTYACKIKSRTSFFRSFTGLLDCINRLRRGRAYLIQKGIHLATVGDRPIDYRVKYVKTGPHWHYRSMVGRIARRGYFVTNLCRGGTMVSAAHGIRHSLSPNLVRVKKREMRHLTKVATGLLERRFPGIGQLGYDYGIDKSGHIWILEVNTRPQ